MNNQKYAIITYDTDCIYFYANTPYLLIYASALARLNNIYMYSSTLDSSVHILSLKG